MGKQLPNEVVDIVLNIFTLHKDDTEWTIPEMVRLMKTTGKGVIIDVLPLPNGQIAAEFLLKLTPRHSKIGTDR